jgi:hypothetical protein
MQSCQFRPRESVSLETHFALRPPPFLLTQATHSLTIRVKQHYAHIPPGGGTVPFFVSGQHSKQQTNVPVIRQVIVAPAKGKYQTGFPGARRLERVEPIAADLFRLFPYASLCGLLPGTLHAVP